MLSRDSFELLEIIVEFAPTKPDHNIVAIIMTPYLKPTEDLLDLKETPMALRPLKKVRIKEPIKFQIEQMQSKVNFTFDNDENGDQALLGDYYSIIVNFQPDEDIILQDIQLQIEGVEVETNVIQGGEMVSSSLDLGNLMQS